MRVLLIATALSVGMPLAGAQTPTTAPGESGCIAAVPAEPATLEATGTPAGGTAPGNSGSTGFSGAGLGGAYSGMTQSGPAKTSPTAQPATAKGLDPIAGLVMPKGTSRC